MKKTKLFMFLSAILIAVVSLTIATSCSKDDSASSSGAHKIVGTWVHESDSDGTESYIFKSDGTGIHKCTGQSDSSFRYSFNESTSEITITEDGETWTEYIKFLSSTSFEWEGVFYKQ